MSAASRPPLSPDRRPCRRRVGRRLAAAAALLATVLATGCTQPPPPKGVKLVEVVVTTPITDKMLDFQDFTGRLAAYRMVDMRARASGYLVSAPFKEGDKVRKGDVLFTIDDRTYTADLNQAEANLQLAVADCNLQVANAGRARQMIGSRAIGKEEYDQIMASRDKSKAAVQAMEAAVERTRVNLSYTKVICPLDGRISRRFVDPGNLVKTDDTMLTTIVADEPVYAYFDVDERTYLDLAGEKPSASQSANLAEMKLPVMMRLANADEFNYAGYVDFVDNQLNGNTGTIRMRGVFSNPRGVLKSGLFVRIRLPVGGAYDTLLIPDDALQSDQGKKYVYIVNDKNEVVYRRVSLGQALGGLRVIKEAVTDKQGKIVEGLKAGERVIVTGMQRVRPKDEVKVMEQPPPAKPDFPLRKLMGLDPEKAPDAPASKKNNQDAGPPAASKSSGK